MPTPVFCCGFECGVLGAVGQHWSITQGTPTIGTTTKLSGNRALVISVAAGLCHVTSVNWGTGPQVGRCYVYFTTLPNDDVVVLQPTGTFTGGIVFSASEGKLFSVAPASAGYPVTTGQWYRLEWKFDPTADTFDWMANGTVGAQVTGRTGTSGSLILGNNTNNSTVSGEMVFDDVIVSQTIADYPIGPGYVHPFVPTADGTHNIAGTGDFQRTLTGTDILNATTTAFQLVDEVPLENVVTDWINMLAPVNATDYVECIFGPAPGIPTPRNAPRAVEVICGINQAATGAGNMEIRLNDNGTMNTVYTATGVAGVAVATGQQFKRKHYAAGPAGAWVIGGGGNGDFTDLRIRFGSPAALDVNPDQYFGCAMIEADFPYKSMPPPLQVPRYLSRRRVK